MFKFLINLLNRNKAKKILSYVDKVETALTLFQSIDDDEDKNEKLIRSLSKKNFMRILFQDIMFAYKKLKSIIKKYNH